MLYLSNAFSLGMIASPEAVIHVEEISKGRAAIEVTAALHDDRFKSVIGHEATASILSELLGIQVAVNRERITLRNGDELIVFQLLTRLPEGKILAVDEIRKLGYRFFLVSINPSDFGLPDERWNCDACGFMADPEELKAMWERGEIKSEHFVISRFYCPKCGKPLALEEVKG
jgi:ribosomal protein S27AE